MVENLNKDMWQRQLKMNKEMDECLVAMTQILRTMMNSLPPDQKRALNQHSGLRNKLIVWADEGAMTKLIAEQANILRGL